MAQGTRDRQDAMATDAASAPTLFEEIIEHMATGVGVYVGTRDAALVPESMVGMGVKAHPDRRTVTVYLPRATATRTLRNLESNGQIAITLVRASTLKGVQLKGHIVGVRESSPLDQELQAVHRAAMVEELAGVGVPRSASRRLLWWPSVAVEVDVCAVFDQTPGPNAGEALGAR